MSNPPHTFRLTPQALANLSAITDRFGCNATAAVEVALALAATVAVTGIAPEPREVAAEFRRRAAG